MEEKKDRPGLKDLSRLAAEKNAKKSSGEKKEAASHDHIKNPAKSLAHKATTAAKNAHNSNHNKTAAHKPKEHAHSNHKASPAPKKHDGEGILYIDHSKKK